RDDEDAIRAQVLQPLYLPAGPAKDDLVHLLGAPEAEVDPAIAVRAIAGTGTYLAEERAGTAANEHFRMRAVAVAPGADGVERDPGMAAPVVIAQQLGRVVLIVRQDVEVAVVIVVAHRQAARDTGLPQVPQPLRDFREPAIPQVVEQLLGLPVGHVGDESPDV